MPFGLFELIAVFSIVLAFAIYELVMVRRARSEDDDGQPRAKRSEEMV